MADLRSIEVLYHDLSDHEQIFTCSSRDGTTQRTGSTCFKPSYFLRFIFRRFACILQSSQGARLHPIPSKALGERACHFISSTQYTRSPISLSIFSPLTTGPIFLSTIRKLPRPGFFFLINRSDTWIVHIDHRRSTPQRLLPVRRTI